MFSCLIICMGGSIFTDMAYMSYLNSRLVVVVVFVGFCICVFLCVFNACEFKFICSYVTV